MRCKFYSYCYLSQSLKVARQLFSRCSYDERSNLFIKCRSLDVTWWPDIEWPGSQTFKGMRKRCINRFAENNDDTRRLFLTNWKKHREILNSLSPPPIRAKARRAIECTLLWRCSSFGCFRVMRRFVKKGSKGQNLTSFDDLWQPDLWPDLKLDWCSFVVIFDTSSNAAYFVSLRGPGAELDGDFQIIPLCGRRAPARHGLNA